jgi:HlyD family secretion protein
VKPGQRATFTGDANPNRTFESNVILVKNMPMTAQSAVTYETHLSVKNDEDLLRPGMTATATIMGDDQSGVLLVPNAARRFSSTERRASDASATATSEGFSVSSILPSPLEMNETGATCSNPKTQQRQKPRVFLLRGGTLQRVDVEMCATDGINAPSRALASSRVFAWLSRRRPRTMADQHPPLSTRGLPEQGGR